MSDSFRRTIAFASNGLSQEKILQHKFPFPSYKRAAADLAGYLSVGRLRPSFDFDHLIQRFALRAFERAFTSHDAPPIPAQHHILSGMGCRAVCLIVKA